VGHDSDIVIESDGIESILDESSSGKVVDDEMSRRLQGETDTRRLDHVSDALSELAGIWTTQSRPGEEHIYCNTGFLIIKQYNVIKATRQIQRIEDIHGVQTLLKTPVVHYNMYVAPGDCISYKIAATTHSHEVNGAPHDHSTLLVSQDGTSICPKRFLDGTLIETWVRTSDNQTDCPGEDGHSGTDFDELSNGWCRSLWDCGCVVQNKKLMFCTAEKPYYQLVAQDRNDKGEIVFNEIHPDAFKNRKGLRALYLTGNADLDHTKVERTLNRPPNLGHLYLYS